MAGVSECYHGEHVRVFRLDAERVRARLARAAGRLLAERDDVRQIWLFGSLARGEAMPGSDADLLFVVRDGAGAFLDRSASLAQYFEGVGVGCDVLVYTESEFDRLAREPSLAKTARDEGLLLSA